MRDLPNKPHLSYQNQPHLHIQKTSDDGGYLGHLLVFRLVGITQTSCPLRAVKWSKGEWIEHQRKLYIARIAYTYGFSCFFMPVEHQRASACSPSLHTIYQVVIFPSINRCKLYCWELWIIQGQGAFSPWLGRPRIPSIRFLSPSVVDIPVDLHELSKYGQMVKTSR